MNEYPITFTDANGNEITGFLVTDVTLPTDFWALTPQSNGAMYSATPGGPPPSPVWAALPNLLNLTAAQSTNIKTTYVTPSSGITLALWVQPAAGGAFVQNGALPAGFTFDGTNFAYNGTSVSAAAQNVYFVATVTATGAQSNSGTFSCSGAGSGLPADTTAPTIPVGLGATAVTQTTATLSWEPASDPSISTQAWSGLSKYTLHVKQAGADISGSPFTISQGPGNQPNITGVDIGTPSTPTVYAQTGADIAMTSYANSSFTPGPDSISSAMQALTGTGWVLSTRIDSFSAGGYAYAKMGLGFWNGLGNASAYIRVNVNPGGNIDVESRVSSGAQPQALVARGGANSFPIYLIAQQISATSVAFYVSFTGNIDSTAISLGTFSFNFASTFYGGVTGNTDPGEPVPNTFTFKQVNITSLADPSQALTGLSANTAYTATLTSTDVAGNVSAASNALTFSTQPTSGGGFPSSRSKFNWPFGSATSGDSGATLVSGTANSVWNQSIGSNATWHTPVTPIPTTVPGGWFCDIEMLPSRVADVPAYTEHTVNIYQQSSPGWTANNNLCAYNTNSVNTGTPNALPVAVPLPDNYDMSGGFPEGSPEPSVVVKANFCCAVIENPTASDPNVHHSQQFARCGTYPANASTYYMFNSNIYSSGSDAPYSRNLKGSGRIGSHGASCLSALGGALRASANDHIGPIYHALKMTATVPMLWKASGWNTLPGERIGYSDTTVGYTWPASRQDLSAQYKGSDQYLKMGSLLSFNMTPSQYATFRATLSGGGNGYGAIIADAVYNYGIYIVDIITNSPGIFPMTAVEPNPTTGARQQFADVLATQWPGLNMNYPPASPSATGTVSQKWQYDLVQIFGNVEVVLNNSPTSIGGGGTPRMPPAPPFSD